MSLKPRQFPIEKQDYRGALPDGLPPVQMPQGLAGQAAATGFGALADKFGGYGNQAAKAEGERDAKIAAADGRFDRTGRDTIYGQTYDNTALSAQIDSVTATFRNQTLSLFDQHRNDPAALTDALGRASRDAEQVLPAEARAGFRTRAGDIGLPLQRQALSNAQSLREAEARATLIRRTGETEQNNRRSLAIAPFDPEIERTVRQSNEGLIASIRGQAAGGLITPDVAERQIAQIESGTEAQIIEARARSLRTPEEIEAYRAKLQQEAREGRLPRTVDVATVDAELMKIAQQRRVEGDRQLREYQGKVDDVLSRATRGQSPTTAEMASLEADAQRLGPRGQVALETMRTHVGIAQRMSTMSMPERDAYYRSLEGEMQRASAGGGAVSPRATSAVQYFMGRGWSRVQAAAIVGHMTMESGLDTTARNPGDGRDGSDSIGVSQWNAHRAQALAAFAASRGKPVTDFETQLAFTDAELRGQIAGSDESRWGRALMAASDTRAASRAMISYLRPAGWTAENPEGGHNFAQRTAAADRLAGSVTRAGAETLQWVREQNDAARNQLNSDPLGFALAQGRAGGPATVLDMNAAPDVLAAQMRARVAQADAALPSILGHTNVPYLRPDERTVLQGAMAAGGERALATVEALVAGGGARATKILAEIGGDAPALAHAAALSLATGDRSFALRVAEGLRTDQVSGASPARPSEDDVRAAETAALGASMRAYSPEARERTRAAVLLWFRAEAHRRGADPKGNVQPLLEEGFRAARGELRVNGVTYGGIARYSSSAFNSVPTQVQVPPSVRQDRFTQVLGAITDADLEALGDRRPVGLTGQPMDAGALRRMMPAWGDGGYRFFMPSVASSGVRRPVVTANGQPFHLDFRAIEPTLRARVPGAFR